MFQLKRQPSHPGQILKEEFLDELGITQVKLAEELSTTFRTINEIINEKRSISPEMALKLSKHFGTSPEVWLNLQNNYDLYKVYSKKKAEINKIKLNKNLSAA
ncbi:MAG: HigA family addiction module antitoxin [Ignavibacteria bacterium]|jgi:addiction module HigA family antidote